MTESNATKTAAQQLHTALASACQANGGERFQLVQAASTTLILSGRRFLSCRLRTLTLPLAPPVMGTTAGSGSGLGSGSHHPPAPPVFDVGIDLCAGCTIDGRVPPFDYYGGTPHRFLVLQGRIADGQVLWTYRCPRPFINSMPSSRRQASVDLTNAQLTAACFRLLALAPVFPPEKLTVARTIYNL
jgi:hypothetical protein